MGSGKLPEGWVCAEIGDVTERAEKIDPRNTPDRIIRYIDISSIDNKRFRIAGPSIVKLSEAPSRARQLIREGDTLFSLVRPYLKNIAFVDASLDGEIASTGFCVLRSNGALDPKFLFYRAISQDFVNSLSEGQYGVSYPAVNDQQVRAQLIAVAPLNEQRRIVEKIETLFAELDKGEESLRQAQTLLARYRQSVLKAAVTGELTADWRARHAGKLEHGRDLLARILKARRENWQGRGKYKEPNQPDVNGLPELPENWAWANLESLAANTAHAMVDGPFGSKLKTEHYTTSGVRVIRLENIGDGVFIDKKSYISQEHAAELQRHSISGGDIVIASLGVQLPKACIVPDRISTAIVKADCIKFSPNTDFVVPNFIMAWLNSPQLRRRVSISIRGVGRPRLNLADLRSLAVPLPSQEEQREIARLIEVSERFVHSIDYYCDAALKQSSALRQSILNTAFSGKLVPQELNDEPASELLARIRAQRTTESRKPGRRKVSA